MADRLIIEDLGDIELTPEEAARFEAAIEQAEEDVSSRKTAEVRVNFRWGARQLQIVKEAAETMGIPYQSYMKVVLLKQARSDLLEQRSLQEPSYGDDQSDSQPLRLVRSRG